MQILRQDFIIKNFRRPKDGRNNRLDTLFLFFIAQAQIAPAIHRVVAAIKGYLNFAGEVSIFIEFAFQRFHGQIVFHRFMRSGAQRIAFGFGNKITAVGFVSRNKMLVVFRSGVH